MCERAEGQKQTLFTIPLKCQCSPHLCCLIRLGCIRRGLTGTCPHRLWIVWFLRLFPKFLHRRLAYLAGIGEVVPSLRWPRNARARVGTNDCRPIKLREKFTWQGSQPIIEPDLHHVTLATARSFFCGGQGSSLLWVETEVESTSSLPGKNTGTFFLGKTVFNQ